MNFNKLYKLKKMLNLFAEETTVDGETITYNGELAIGIEIFIIDENGEPVIAPNGTYKTDSKIIVVEDGKVASIEEKTNEENIEENLEENIEENVENENLEELKNKIAELEAKLAEKEAEIEQLKKTIETLKKQVEETVDKPVDEVENQFSKQITFLETVRNKMKK